jgi:hypothetical protein
MVVGEVGGGGWQDNEVNISEVQAEHQWYLQTRILTTEQVS